jgi:hypothetical protein
MYTKGKLMKGIFYKMMFTAILLAGIVIGIVKGQEARQKWVSKKKVKYEAKRTLAPADNPQVVLDEIEMATYHHSI